MVKSEYKESLPVGRIAGEVNASLEKFPRLVVTAPPGSGKSTLLPLTMLESAGVEKIIMLEPRRAAARQIAMRMSRMLGEEVGETVGYRMRFESRVSAATKIEVVTEGVMERMLVDDPTLDGISAVIFDEFHERSLTADMTLALVLDAQREIRPDLKVVIMSATIETTELCASLDAPLIKAEGKMYGVEIIYGDDIDARECAQAVASVVRRVCREQSGNILAFLPGYGEIARCAELLENLSDNAFVVPLHGMLPAADQYRAIEYNPSGKRKIVLATPIAETSLTIEGITAVVDSGFYRAVEYDASTGLQHLVTRRISLDMAAQRSGRAGRLSEGVCYRLWSKAAEMRMSETRTPEILDADLSGMLLDIVAWGGNSVEKLPWITPPASRSVAEGRRLLQLLGAVDKNGAITSRGKRMADLPTHPRLSSMLVDASERGLGSLASDIAAILEEKDVVNDEKDCDINTRILSMREARRRNSLGRWKRIADIASQFRRMTRSREVNDCSYDSEDAGMLLCRAYPERVAMKLRDRVYRLRGGENVAINADDNLSASDYLAVASMGKRIFLASPVAKSILLEMSEPHRNISWSGKEGKLLARMESRIGVLVVDSRRISDLDNAESARVIGAAAVKEGRSMFDFNSEVSSLQQRIAQAAEWHPEMHIPDMSTDALLSSAPEWVPLYIDGAVDLHGLRKVNLCEVIRGLVGYQLMQEIDRIAPTRMRLPRGRSVRIDYRPGSAAPIVSARLQDCLGLYDTPMLDGGRRPVLMELLSPGYKPVQLTQDMRGFWSNTYFEVRKELKRRYPKHQWPDDPLAFNVD